MLIKLKPLLINLSISLGTGILSAVLTMGSMDIYKDVQKPTLAPPGWIFPIVWTILFTLMGISAYIINESSAPDKGLALKVYALQLVFNFLWSIVFFNNRWYLFAFIWLIALWILILVMILLFYKIEPIAAYLQIPYLLWVTFAGYLNFIVYLLNK